MPELRHDPIQKRWVIIATERSRRPDDFPRLEQEVPEGFLSFLRRERIENPSRDYRHSLQRPGKELSGMAGACCVPNKFPALRIEGFLDRKASGFMDRMNGVGAHEVIIETPQTT